MRPTCEHVRMTLHALDEIDLSTERFTGDELHDFLRRAREQGPVAQVLFYGASAFLITRFAVLREYFGEEPGEPCGMCDVCEDRPERADGFFAPVKAPSKTVLVKKSAVKPKRSRRSRRGGKSSRRRRRPGRSGGDVTGSPP